MLRLVEGAVFFTLSVLLPCSVSVPRSLPVLFSIPLLLVYLGEPHGN
jgi:hypothetical protein